MLGTRSWGACCFAVLAAAGCGVGKGSTGGTGGESATGAGAGSSSATGVGASTAAGTGGSTATASSGTASGCPVFLSTSPWNTDISQAPTTTLYTLPSANLHPDFDDDPADGIPYQYVTNAVTKSPVTFQYASESDPGPYPIPANPLIEGGSDGHMLMVQTDECVLYELFAASLEGSTWNTGSGAIWDLKTNATRPFCWTSADAAGLPIFPGLARYEEVAAGAIDHALRFTMSTVQTAFVAPANHLVSASSSPSAPPFGLRVRLMASVDISGAPPQAMIILTALKKYGLILADIGSDWYITGASNPGWNFDGSDVTYLEKFTGSQFEVIDPGPVTTPTSTPSCSP